jgi:hypothetical protein
MVHKLMISVVALLVGVEFAAGEEFDAVINDATRAFTRRKASPEALHYGKLTLDSRGKVVSTIIQEGLVTRATNVVMGKFNEKTKRWTPGEKIEGGLEADFFHEADTVVQARITVAADRKTIQQILVTKTNEPLVMADSEFDAVLRQIGPQTNGNGAIAYVRLDLDDKGRVLKTFPLRTGRVTADTKVAMGKLNEETKAWEAGDEIPMGLYGEVFKNLGAQTIYVRMKFSDDNRSISQILVRQVGERARR